MICLAEREEREYTCLWCGTTWKQFVGTAVGQGNGKHSKATTQVKCIRCKNGQKTYQ